MKTLDATHTLLQLWAANKRAEYDFLGYSKQPLSRMSESPKSDMPDEADIILEEIAVALESLEQAEPEMAFVIQQQYVHEKSFEDIGLDLIDPLTKQPKAANTVSNMSLLGLAMIAGGLSEMEL